MRPAALAALPAVAIVLLAGCSSGDVAESPEPEEPTSRASQSEASEPEASAPGTSQSEEEQSDAHGDLACDDRTLEEIDDTIGGQLRAFAEGDYSAALEFASEGFQEDFDQDSFRELIETSFPNVAQATGHTSNVCVNRGDDAQLLVTVESDEGDQELVYQMILESEQWRIEGAVPAGANPSESEPIEV